MTTQNEENKKDLNYWIKKYPELIYHKYEIEKNLKDKNLSECVLRFGDFEDFDFVNFSAYIPAVGWIVFIENQSINNVFQLGDRRKNTKETKDNFGILLDVDGDYSKYIALFDPDNRVEMKEFIYGMLEVENKRYENYQNEIKNKEEDVDSDRNNFSENYTGLSVFETINGKKEIVASFVTKYQAKQNREIESFLKPLINKI